jgi:hypothetical protein
MMYKNKFKARQTTMGNPLSSNQRVAQYLTGNFFFHRMPPKRTETNKFETFN